METYIPDFWYREYVWKKRDEGMNPVVAFKYMSINTDKTKVVLFNAARKYEFMAQLSIGGNTQLEVVEQFRLLGVIFKSNLS